MNVIWSTSRYKLKYTISQHIEKLEYEILVILKSWCSHATVSVVCCLKGLSYISPAPPGKNGLQEETSGWTLVCLKCTLLLRLIPKGVVPFKYLPPMAYNGIAEGKMNTVIQRYNHHQKLSSVVGSSCFSLEEGALIWNQEAFKKIAKKLCRGMT